MNFSPRKFEAVGIWRTGPSGFRYAGAAGFSFPGPAHAAPDLLKYGGILGRKASPVKIGRRMVRRLFLFPSALRGGCGAVRTILPPLALLLVALSPLWLASAHNESLRLWFSNSAYAAIRPATGRLADADGMSPAERRRLAAPVRAILVENADRLIGMGSREVALAFSRPELERDEGGIMIWQYRAGRCVVDIYFGPAAEGADERKVVYYETRARGKAVLGAVAAETEGAESALAGCLQTAMTETREFPAAAFVAAMR